jgi:AcrR family transcriptional regulator
MTSGLDPTFAGDGDGARALRLRGGDIRQRFIDVTTDLLREHGLAGVSTRLVCDTVGVKAPTLYHHFGDFSGLRAAVVEHAFEQYLNYGIHNASPDDVFARIRQGWDTYVAFAQAEPALFAIIAQQNVVGELPAQILSAHAKLTESLQLAGQIRPLRYTPELGAQIFSATCIGVASMLAAQTRGLPNEPNLSAAAREAVLSCLFL